MRISQGSLPDKSATVDGGNSIVKRSAVKKRETGSIAGDQGSLALTAGAAEEKQKAIASAQSLSQVSMPESFVDPREKPDFEEVSNLNIRENMTAATGVIFTEGNRHRD